MSVRLEGGRPLNLSGKELVAELKKSPLVRVVSLPAKADAVLTGAGELWIRGYYSLNPRSGIMPQNGTPVYGGSLSVELNGKDSDTLWSYLVTPHFGSTSISKDLCKELVRRMNDALRDAGHPSRSSSRTQQP